MQCAGQAGTGREVSRRARLDDAIGRYGTVGHVARSNRYLAKHGQKFYDTTPWWRVDAFFSFSTHDRRVYSLNSRRYKTKGRTSTFR